MNSPLRLLMAFEAEDDVALLRGALKAAGYTMLYERVDTDGSLRAALDRQTWDIVFADDSVPGWRASEALRRVKEREPELPFLLVSGHLGDDAVVELMKAGALDYLRKDDLSALGPAVARALHASMAQRERKRAEAALRESEERFALAVRGSRDGLWDWNILTSQSYLSPRFKEMLGFEEQEFNASLEDFLAVILDEDRERVRAALQEHLMRRVPYEVELRAHTKQGDLRWFCSRGQALWDEEGNPTRMAGSLSDLTERKRAEEALRAQLALTQRQRDEIRALSMPLIEVWDGVLTVPVLGSLDPTPAMTEGVLHAVTRARYRQVIFDLTSVPFIDGGAADQLLKLVMAVELLGARAIVVGIRPALARVIVEAGLDLSRLKTFATLRDALVFCMKLPAG